MPLKIFLFTALMIFGARVHVDLGPVDFILSDYFVLLAGLMLGWRAVFSVGLYLLMGAAGLSVFAGGSGGIEHFASPTGGFLFGFLVAGFVVGKIAHGRQIGLQRDALATVTGQAIVFFFGLLGMKLVMTDATWADIFSRGFLPFVGPIVIKFFAAVLGAYALRYLPWFQQTD